MGQGEMPVESACLHCAGLPVMLKRGKPGVFRQVILQHGTIEKLFTNSVHKVVDNILPQARNAYRMEVLA